VQFWLENMLTSAKTLFESCALEDEWCKDWMLRKRVGREAASKSFPERDLYLLADVALVI
jgi:hypothetical protein